MDILGVTDYTGKAHCIEHAHTVRSYRLELYGDEGKTCWCGRKIEASQLKPAGTHYQEAGHPVANTAQRVSRPLVDAEADPGGDGPGVHEAHEEARVMTDVELTPGQYEALMDRTRPNDIQTQRVRDLRAALDRAMLLRSNHRYAVELTAEMIETASFLLKVAAALQGGKLTLASNLFVTRYVR